MNLLQQFASFLGQYHLQDVVARQWSALQKEKLPVTQAALAEVLQQLLVAIEQGTEMDLVRQRLQALQDKPLQSDAELTLPQLHEIITQQKLALLQFVPCFVENAEMALKLTTLLEDRYAGFMALLMEFFEDRYQRFLSRLIESEERYRDLFDNAHDLIHILEPDGSIIYVNQFWLNSLEYRFEEIVGKVIYDFVDEEERERFRTYRTHVLNGVEKEKEITFPFRTKSGRKLIVEGFVSPRFQQGKAIATRGIFRDVTERIKNEEERNFYTKQLAEREENLNKLVTHAPDAIIVANAVGTIILWNPKAEEFFGWTAAEAVGRQLHDTIIPPAYRQAHRTGMQRYMDSGETHILNQTIEITALHKSGREFPISLTISQSQQGGEAVFISFSRDLTRQKKAELELQRQQKELEQSTRELEQYAWLTSHDLREPLRKILTFSNLIETRYPEVLQTGAKEYLLKIQDAGKRMGTLIEAILYYSSFTENTQMAELVNLNQVMQQVLADLEVPIKETNADVQAGPLPTVEAIPIQMKQLLQNLVSNAIKYHHPNRRPEIGVTARNINAHTVELIVRDNGRGFSMQDEKKIFGLFARLTHEKGLQGTGVGLALCKKIALNHGGNISVQSAPGEGATFYVSLPIKQPTF